MIQWSNFDGQYLIIVGNRTAYAKTIADAMVVKTILEFGVKLSKLLK